MGSKSDSAMETKLVNMININKKHGDNAINTIQRDLLAKLTKMEEEWQGKLKQMEEAQEKERGKWNEEKEEMKKTTNEMQAKINGLEEELAVFRNRSIREEGEILEMDKEAMKEELAKVMKEELEVKTKAITAHMEASRDGWVEVVKKNLKEAKENAQKEETLIVHTTLEEEKMRNARRLNIRVTGIEEKQNLTPDADGRALCTKLGYKEDEPPPFMKAWRVGKDLTKKRPLILNFPSEEARALFLKKRVILRGITGPPIYLDDDLTKMQVEHRRACMPKVHQARKEGKKATYRDGRVIIDGKTIA